MTSAKHIREAMELTQFQMAVKHDIGVSTIQAFEMGKLRSPTLRSRRKLAAAYSVTLAQVDALARGESIQWTPKLPASGFDLGRLKQQAATVVQDRDFSAGPDIHRMCTSDERSDVCVRHLSPPEWITDLAEGRDNPVIAERLGWLHQPEHAGAA